MCFLYFSFLFFFYCYGDHRDLHSFPTRRSSDLGVSVGIALVADGLGTGMALVAAALVRSEEHTSELQSRQYLVCRLLLEKKKKIKNEMTKCYTKLAHLALNNTKDT